MSRSTAPVWVACMVLATGCGVSTQRSPDVVPADQLPAPLRPATPSSSTPPLPSLVKVYLVRAGARLAAIDVEAARSTPRSATEALFAVDAPEGDLRNAVPTGAAVRSAELASGVMSIDVTEEFGLVGGRDQLLAVAQIVWTVTEYRDVQQVRLAVDGRYVAVPIDGGATSEQPVGREDYSTVAPR